jgi:hypothetical protein
VVFSLKKHRDNFKRLASNVEGMIRMKNAYNISVGKPKGRRPLGRPRRRWEDIRIDLMEIG